MKPGMLKRPRDGRLDTLRGLFLVIMTIDHLAGYISRFTFESFGFVSAAAGFVLLSGYMYGMHGDSGQTTLAPRFRKVMHRVGTLYRYQVFIVLFLFAGAALSSVYGGYWSRTIDIPGSSIAASFLYALVLLHQPPFLDILPMYIFFLLLTPFVQLAFHRNLQLLVLVLSLSLWLLGQYVDPLELLSAVSGVAPRIGVFNLFAWQLLWIGGLYAGYLHGTCQQNNLLQKPAWLFIASATAIVFFLARHDVIAVPPALALQFDKSDLRILRVVNTLCLVTLACWIIKLLPISFKVPVVSTLGRYSLQVLAVHIVLLYLAQPVFWRMQAIGVGAETVFSLGIIVALWMTIPAYQLYLKSKTRLFGRRTLAGIAGDGMRQLMTRVETAIKQRQ
ncbi:MAG: OpgC domain-containing protein [Janthinobacterium lividum]